MIHLKFFHFLLWRRGLLFDLLRTGYDSLKKWIFVAFFTVFGILLLFLFLVLGLESPFLWVKHSGAVRLVVNVSLLPENMLRKGDLSKKDGFQARDATHWTSDFCTRVGLGCTGGCERRFSLELSILVHCSTLLWGYLIIITGMTSIIVLERRTRQRGHKGLGRGDLSWGY